MQAEGTRMVNLQSFSATSMPAEAIRPSLFMIAGIAGKETDLRQILQGGRRAQTDNADRYVCSGRIIRSEKEKGSFRRRITGRERSTLISCAPR